MWFNKFPKPGDLALALFYVHMNQGVSPTLVSSGMNGSRSNAFRGPDWQLHLMECRIERVGNEENTEPGLSYVTVASTSPVTNRNVSSTLFVYPDYLENSCGAVLDKVALPEGGTQEDRERVLDFMLPVPVCTRSYKQIINDIRGDNAVPASVVHEMDSIVQWFRDKGVLFSPLVEQELTIRGYDANSEHTLAEIYSRYATPGPGNPRDLRDGFEEEEDDADWEASEPNF